MVQINIIDIAKYQFKFRRYIILKAERSSNNTAIIVFDKTVDKTLLNVEMKEISFIHLGKKDKTVFNNFRITVIEGNLVLILFERIRIEKIEKKISANLYFDEMEIPVPITINNVTIHNTAERKR